MCVCVCVRACVRECLCVLIHSYICECVLIYMYVCVLLYIHCNMLLLHTHPRRPIPRTHLLSSRTFPSEAHELDLWERGWERSVPSVGMGRLVQTVGVVTVLAILGGCTILLRPSARPKFPNYPKHDLERMARAVGACRACVGRGLILARTHGLCARARSARTHTCVHTPPHAVLAGSACMRVLLLFVDGQVGACTL